jgi:hypothetical protein
MTRRSKIWLAVATLFTLINIGGAVFAAAGGEGLHAAVHIALAALGGFYLSNVLSRSRRQHLAGTDEVDQRLDRLQQSVDAVAIEVERIGEAQRFTAKLAAELGEKPSPERAPAVKRPNENRS